MEKNFTRKDFLKTTTMAGMALATSSFNFEKYIPLLSFSTLGCPDWNFEKIINFAFENGYKGVELRGILRQLDLTKCPEFSTKENITATRKLIGDKKLKIVDLGCSTELHHGDPGVRKKNLDEAKDFILLAQQLGCPYIRVFPNTIPKGQDKNKTIELIVNGLAELANSAKGTSVTVLMETHGDVLKSADIKKIMQAVNNPNAGLVWDIVNMWSVTKESPAEMYENLKSYIYHTHIKDLKFVDGKEQYVLMGKGEAPIFEAIDILEKNQYKGYFSFEWEKLWFPEIADPEIAIADYAKVMKAHFKL